MIISGRASDHLLTGLFMLSLAAAASNVQQASTMRREQSSFSVGDQGELAAAIHELKDVAEHASVTVQGAEDFDRASAREEVDPRGLLTQRSDVSDGNDNSCKGISGHADCDKSTSNICGWQSSSAGVSGSCRSCASLTKSDCQNAKGKGSKCAWQSTQCKATTSLVELDPPSTTSNGMLDTQGKPDANADDTFDTGSLASDDEEPYAEASAADESDGAFSEIDARDLLSKREDYKFTDMNCKKAAKTRSLCDKVSDDQCGWQHKTKTCRMCSGLSESDCKNANSNKSPCVWTKSCGTTSALMEDFAGNQDYSSQASSTNLADGADDVHEDQKEDYSSRVSSTNLVDSADDVHEDQKEDMRDLLTKRNDVIAQGSCKTVPNVDEATCNAADHKKYGTCGWSTSQSKCVSAGNLTEAECKAVKDKNGQCSWSTTRRRTSGYCIRDTSLPGSSMEEEASEINEAVSVDAATPVHSLVKDHVDPDPNHW